MNRHHDTPGPRRGRGLAGGVGIAAALAVCCGAKLLLLGGLAAGVTGGLLGWWPLLIAAGALVAWALWQRTRGTDRDGGACPAPNHDHGHLHGADQTAATHRGQRTTAPDTTDTLAPTREKR